MGLDRPYTSAIRAPWSTSRRAGGKKATTWEVLCALVIWRDWIDTAADDPRHELAFHVQLGDYGRELRQEGGGITKAWTPGAPPDEWVR